MVAVPLFWFAAGLVRRDVGRALIAMRDNETAARTMGVNLATFKTRAFGLSAAYAGIAGSLFTFAIGFVAPESFTLTVSFAFLAAIVVGGLATVAGARVRRAVHRLRARMVVRRRRGAVGRDLRRDADRVHVRVPRRHHGVAAQRLGTAGRGARVNHREERG